MSSALNSDNKNNKDTCFTIGKCLREREVCMAFIAWDQRFSVGNDELDHQHKQLFHLINILEESTDDSTKLLENTLMQLVDYLETHFKAEENYMKEIQYPNLEKHHQEHAEFVMTTLKFVKSFQKNGKVIKGDVISYLKDWLLTHILHSDVKFAKYANVTLCG